MEPLIEEIWTWESVQHGDACLINAESLSGICEQELPRTLGQVLRLITCAVDWSDNTRDILNFLLHFLPSSAAIPSLPTHLQRVPISDSEDRKVHGFRDRTFVVIGHSYGGCTSYCFLLRARFIYSLFPSQDSGCINPSSTLLIFGVDRPCNCQT